MSDQTKTLLYYALMRKGANAANLAIILVVLLAISGIAAIFVGTSMASIITWLLVPFGEMAYRRVGQWMDQ
jgi:hypothetical protein